ncbi:efflux RND transporter periplasmic adaptor subunit [Actibacterium lipolyticum]|uniref:Toluene efflux pump periplasmic linker protein TtgA n=1 Tax=Actibacterium lipolyticum TaxID=1524263 RepID=A0A238JVC4_9RHOB|nr:efflux RND transporter periplasmic adaptor subunit [Actibacterium lipolyticum]SMX34453.1 Toluene efflux pump periplasmic linker protein TtgA precursor [Actibacterium lipolyticum]
MRIISFLTALIVAVVLYLVVMERDRVLSFAGRDDEAVAETTAEAPTETVETDERTVSVVAVHSTARPIDAAVLVRGLTEAARQVDVRAETTGRVISEPLRKGAFVNEGQMICQIDPGTRASNVAQAEAQLAEAKANLPVASARVEEAKSMLSEAEINNRAAVKLQADGYASESRAAATTAAVSSAMASVEAAKSGLDAANSGVSAAEAAVATAKKEIERLTIVAPFAGLLESDSAELGELLQPGSLCATVIQLDPIKLVGFVPETEVEKVSVGARAGGRLATGRAVEGRVTFLSRAADPATRTFRVEVEIPNRDLAIRDGQTVEMALSSGATQAHLLPQSALTLNDTGRVGVRLVDGENRAAFAAVDVLRDTVDGIWLTGLPDAADVIVVGQEYVVDGVPVLATYEGGEQ